MQAVWCTRNLHQIVGNSGRLYYSELPNILASDVKGEYIAKEQKQSETLGSLLGKELENMDDHGCPKVQDIVDEEFNQVTHSDTRLHTTVQSG